MLFVPLEMSLLLHDSFFFPSSKCPSLFQLIFGSLFVQTLPSILLLDPEKRRSVPPLYLRLAESVEGPKVVFSSEPSWGELKFFHPHAVSQGTHSILPLTCSTCLWWACRCLALLSSLFQKLEGVWGCNSSLIRVIFITFWLSGRFWRSKYKLQVVTSMCKQWGHAALLCKRRNPEGDPKLRTYTSPLFCGK